MISSLIISGFVFLAPPAEIAHGIQAENYGTASITVVWTAERTSKGWAVKNADALIRMPDKKTAKRVAKRFNQIESKESGN